MNNKGQILDMEILFSIGFIILAVMAVSATIIGWGMGRKMGYEAMPIWQLVVILGVELMACYVFVLKMSS